jgi:hypothetical protein
LLGASSAIRQSAGTEGSYYVLGLELRERMTEAVRELLGEEGLAAARAERESLVLDEAIALAKDVLDR